MVQRRAARFVMSDDSHARHVQCHPDASNTRIANLEWTESIGKSHPTVSCLIAVPPTPPCIYPTSHNYTHLVSCSRIGNVLPAYTRAAPILELEGISLQLRLLNAETPFTCTMYTLEAKIPRRNWLSQPRLALWHIHVGTAQHILQHSAKAKRPLIVEEDDAWIFFVDVLAEKVNTQSNCK